MSASEWLGRKEAATYMTKIGYPITARTLGNWGNNDNAKGGPPFRRVNWSRVMYLRSDLDEWVAKNVKVVA